MTYVGKHRQGVAEFDRQIKKVIEVKKIEKITCI